MKRKSINLFEPADSLVADLGLKNLNGHPSENSPQYTFWTRMDEQLSVQHLLLGPASDASYQPRTHSEFTVFICLAGTFALTQFGVSDTVSAGSVVVSNAGIEHSTRCVSCPAQPCEILSLTFSPQFLAAFAAEFQLPATGENMSLAFLGGLANELMHRCALEIRRELAQRHTGYKMAVETIALRLLVEVLRAWPRSQIRSIAADFAPRLSYRDFIRTYEFMRQCRKETFRLHHLCQYLGISEERFTRLFLASTKNTPANYYNRMLLEHGRELLRDPSRFIKEISFELGFKTTSHFIASFRREFGATPQEYRMRTLPAPVLLDPVEPALVA